MRIIDADALKRKAQRVATESWKMRLTARIETTLNQFIDWIDNAPTVQPEPDCALPEIIRCKNCKYLVVEEDGTYCDYNIVGVRGLEDGSGFCSDAKRKMDNE